MKKHILILRYVITLGISMALFSCRKHADNVTPIVTKQDTIYRPVTIFDNLGNRLIDYKYDPLQRINTSTYYKIGRLPYYTETYTSYWYYSDNLIYKTDSIVDVKTALKYNSGYDSLILNNDHTIQEIQAGHNFWDLSVNPVASIWIFWEKIGFTYTNQTDSLSIGIKYTQRSQGETNWTASQDSTLSFNQSKNKSVYQDTYSIDSAVAVKGQFLDATVYKKLFSISYYVAPNKLPARIIRNSPADIETITWELDSKSRPTKAHVYSEASKSFIKYFTFTY